MIITLDSRQCASETMLFMINRHFAIENTYFNANWYSKESWSAPKQYNDIIFTLNRNTPSTCCYASGGWTNDLALRTGHCRLRN